LRILNGAFRGAVAGAGIAILMISLDYLGPFSVPVNSFIERATFRLCPLFILGFSSDVKSMTSLILITIIGNALLYGALFALITLGIALLRRFSTQSK
jgi:hypothetical protein